MFMKSKPNILFFITHDQGQLLGCYDSPQMPNMLNTPNINYLAENGVKFTNNFCTAPQCSPSRGSILTSLYPHQHGLMGLVNRGWTLPESNKTFPMYLKENGYSTYLLGLQHESQDASTLGYDSIIKENLDFRYTCKIMEDDILKFLSDHDHDESPFYICIGTFEVHIPFKPWGIPVDHEEVKVPPFLPDHIQVRRDLAELYGAIHAVDGLIGKIIKSLEKNGLKDNTLMIYTTDHGIAFPRAKCTLYDPGIKTSLVMSLPNSDLLNEGRVINGMISNIDLLPTILDFIGADPPKDVEGRSFLPILKREKEIIRSEVFAEKTYHEIYDPIRCVRTDKYKHIRNFEKSETLYEIPAFMNYQRSTKLIRKYMKERYEKPRMEEELYDLEKDPNEENNLIKDPLYKAIKIELSNKLHDWMEQTNDPILKEKVEKPRNE